MQKHVFDQKRNYDPQARQRAYLQLSRPGPAKAVFLSAMKRAESRGDHRVVAYLRIERGLKA